MALTHDQTVITNGVNVTELSKTIDALRRHPELGAFQFRSKNSWLEGGHNRSTIQGFSGCGREDETRAEPFIFDADEPPVLHGGDNGANPVEFILHALGACMTTTMVYHAASRGIEIGAVSSELEGDIDVRGFMGLTDDVRKGYHDVRVKMRVQSDASPDQLAQLAKYSPVYDVVSNSLPVHVLIETY
jgi:uncharacterized OsmC-like protein